MMKNFIIALLVSAALVVGLTACGKSESEKTSKSSDVAKEADATEEVTEAATTTEAEPEVKGTALNNDQLDVSKYSSELIEWGSGGPRDDLNRSAGAVMYQDKYKDFNAYFIAPMEDKEDKVIYLTFDIGYTNEATTDILDTLKEKDVPGVFFATLDVIENQKEICNRIINEGHELANHSVSHTNMAAKSVEEQTKEIMDVNDAALKNYNYQMHLWRYPEGKFSEQGLAVVNNCNYRAVFWSFAHHDWVVEDQPPVGESLQNAVDCLAPGSIYLLHGISSTNAAILPDLIDQARDKGYRFELLQ
jgi:peptidoglycan-N-acetylmuramic acid deacetylase